MKIQPDKTRKTQTDIIQREREREKENYLQHHLYKKQTNRKQSKNTHTKAPEIIALKRPATRIHKTS